MQARPLRAKTLQWLGFEIGGRRIYAVTRSQYANVNVSFVGNYPAVSFSSGCLSRRLLTASSRDVRALTRRNTQFEDLRYRLSRSGPTEQATRRQSITSRAQLHPQNHPRSAPRVAGINAVVSSCRNRKGGTTPSLGTRSATPSYTAMLSLGILMVSTQSYSGGGVQHSQLTVW